ncbi:MAG: hypothetical protein R2748_31940 [Bryobacterales bacterium]
MDQDLLLKIMAAFTGVAAIALIIMMGMMIAIYKSVSAMRERSTVFLDRWEPVAEDAKKTLGDFRTQSSTILGDVKKLTENGKTQMERVEVLLTDLQSAAKTTFERVDESLAINLRRVDETTEAVQNTVLKPVRQVRGMAAAVDAVIRHLSGRNRPTVDRATIDEEMFI